MMEESSSKEDLPPLAKVLHPLSYEGLRPGRTVTIERCANSLEAAMQANRLEAEGIGCITVNANVNNLGIPYSGFTTVDVQVHEGDAERAIEILQTNPDELEPAEESDVAPPAVDEDGRPLKLVEAGRYESVRQLRSAQTLLASSRIRAFPPTLVKRGDRPAGTGSRFVMRVCEQDLESAQALLAKAQTEEDADEDPRCPKCDSWRIYPVGTFWQSLAATFGLCSQPQKQIECLACRYRGSPGEFGVEE
jgi:hypothetical protein